MFLKVNRVIKETLSESSVLAQIGLISDTHFQDRLFALPEKLARVWGPLDLILHAGDVGDLSVLDQLGQMAPVMAVHGNDEPPTAARDLPEQQLLMRGGVRVLLWHSHYPDPVVERANRKGNWGPKLDRLAARTREAGAQVLVYGHSHVPALNRQAGVILFNPGALASGSFFTRQSPQTVGRLRVMMAAGWRWSTWIWRAARWWTCPRPTRPKTSACWADAISPGLSSPNWRHCCPSCIGSNMKIYARWCRPSCRCTGALLTAV